MFQYADPATIKAHLKIDGPHFSPTQYITEYKQVVLIGNGIGATALVSPLNSVAHFLWRSKMEDTKLRNVHFYCIIKHKDIKSFRYLITQVKEACDGIEDLRKKCPEEMKERTFEFHFFITSIPESFEEEQLPAVEDWSFWGRNLRERLGESCPLLEAYSTFSHEDLYKSVEKPPEKCQKLGFVYIHRGRPDWNEQLERIQRLYTSNSCVGVTHCGNPEISRELELYCDLFSSPEDKRKLILHSQKFD